MNPKQTIPLAVTLAPVIAAAPAIIIGGAIGLAAVWLLKNLLDAGTEAQPATENANTEAGTNPAPQLPESPVIFTNPPKPAVRAELPRAVPVVVPARPVPVVSPSVPSVAPAVPPISKKPVARDDLAKTFNHGALALTRKQAVAALKRLGFGKTAAYSALSPNGRFSTLLDFSVGGIISWKG
jgi:hypothetical protein